MAQQLKDRLTIVSSCTLMLMCAASFAKINQVRVINDTPNPVYIHIGGFAPSAKILPNKWKIFSYPFEATKPNTSIKGRFSLLVATAGGKWVTTPNGLSKLENPSMMLCLDYGSSDLLKKSGNRKWVIKKTGGFDKGCGVTPYKQSWYSN